MSNTENKIELVEQEVNVAEALDNAMSSITDEMIEVDEGKYFVRSSETITIRSLISRYKKEQIRVPACQRLYVWKSGDVDLLIDSVNHNFPIGMIILGECEGQKYLLDGLQRVTSLVEKLSSSKIADEEKKNILDYRIITETIHDMSEQDMNAFTQRCNMGVKMASATKHRAGLPKDLFNMIVELAGKEEYRQVKTNRTFVTSAHNELIAMHALLAAANTPVTKNTAAMLCKQLKINADKLDATIFSHAKQSVNELCEAFITMKSYLTNIYCMPDKEADATAEHICVKGLNVNFAAALFRVMYKDLGVTTEEIQYMLKHIFEGKNAIKEYAATTANHSSDEKSLTNRIKILERILDDGRKEIKSNNSTVCNPCTSEECVHDEVEEHDDAEKNSSDASTELLETDTEIQFESEDTETSEGEEVPAEEPYRDEFDQMVDDLEPEPESKFEFNQEDFNVFCGRMMLKKKLSDSSGEYTVRFKDFSDEDVRNLFEAEQTHNTKLWDETVAGCYLVLDFVGEI